MLVVLAAALLYTLPRRPPNPDQAKYDFLRQHRDCSVDSSELEEVDQDRMTFRIKFRTFASNVKQEEVFIYRRVPGRGWHLE
jgi:hypothetical protein